jgi:hypothetical protein
MNPQPSEKDGEDAGDEFLVGLFLGLGGRDGIAV